MVSNLHHNSMHRHFLSTLLDLAFSNKSGVCVWEKLIFVGPDFIIYFNIVSGKAGQFKKQIHR